MPVPNTVYNLLLAFCLLAKDLADFIFGLYLLNYVLKHATNHIPTVGNKLKKLNGRKRQHRNHSE